MSKYYATSQIKHTLLSCALVMTSVGCSHTEKSTLKAKRSVIQLKSKPRPLPVKADEQPPLLTKQKSKHIEIKKNLIPFFRVNRKKTELRNGPGVDFNIGDKFLKYNDIAFVLDRYDQWRKVYAPDRNLKGWVHFKALTMDQSEKEAITADITYFPLVFAKNRLAKVYDFETKKELNQKIEKGHSFYALHKKGNMILVYDSEKKQLAWLNAKDFI